MNDLSPASYIKVTVILQQKQIDYLDSLNRSLGLRPRQLPAAAVIRAVLDAVADAGIDFAPVAQAQHINREDILRAVISKAFRPSK